MKTLKTHILVLISLVVVPSFLALPAFAANRPELGLYRGTGEKANLSDFVEQVVPGTIVLLGEQHVTVTHSGQHMEVLQALRAKGLKVSVGMEFVAYPFQQACDDWRMGLLNDEQFLTAVEWGKTGFEFYDRQMLFPEYSLGERLIALNAPRKLTSRIAKVGVNGLTPEELSLLPPDFTIGNEKYFERFKRSIGHLPDPTKAANYFAAQSAWDDTMAWKAVDFMKTHPDQVLVIIVGEFHVQYGGGLPDRLAERIDLEQHRLISLSQVNLFGLDDEEAQRALLPSEEYGPRASWIWLSSFEN